VKWIKRQRHPITPPPEPPRAQQLALPEPKQDGCCCKRIAKLVDHLEQIDRALTVIVRAMTSGRSSEPTS
jgi:hypothetical protein